MDQHRGTDRKPVRPALIATHTRVATYRTPVPGNGRNETAGASLPGHIRLRREQRARFRRSSTRRWRMALPDAMRDARLAGSEGKK
ncbi:hypothetical protein OPAG_01948 [Rhodococcus opacus PD630]|nr:hypothetical protein Pd630_LPD07630 [Rhodococcus opacus PD630]EHI39305.1 hypothetical protein OPAG_01948 [Rhodococcus opacus PD630]